MSCYLHAGCDLHHTAASASLVVMSHKQPGIFYCKVTMFLLLPQQARRSSEADAPSSSLAVKCDQMVGVKSSPAKPADRPVQGASNDLPVSAPDLLPGSGPTGASAEAQVGWSGGCACLHDVLVL